MPLNFTAIDFETANRHRGSACSVGLAKVRNGAVIDRASWLIQPPGPIKRFDPFHSSLHGITAAHVLGAASWPEAFARILRFIDDDVAVAHNARFDMGVIRHACVAEGLAWPDIPFACSLNMTKRTYSLPSYRLPWVASEAGVSGFVHHDASHDAQVAALITVAMAFRHGVDSIEALTAAVDLRVGSLWGGVGDGTSHGGGASRLVAPTTAVDADPEGHLFGRVVVLTGALLSMTRQEAWDAIAQVGGKPEKGVTKRTNVLVVGDIDPTTLVPGASLTARAQRAFDLQDKGQDIELMTEPDLLRCL